MRANATRDTGLPCLGAVGPWSGGVGQERHHGFESWGGTILRAERAKKFFLTPHFLASGGDKILLR